MENKPNRMEENRYQKNLNCLFIEYKSSVCNLFLILLSVSKIVLQRLKYFHVQACSSNETRSHFLSVSILQILIELYLLYKRVSKYIYIRRISAGLLIEKLYSYTKVEWNYQTFCVPLEVLVARRV